MSGSPEEVNKVLDVVNRTEYMRGYDARNEELNNDPARLNIELNHSYYKTGYLQRQNVTNGDVLKRLLYGKAIITEFIHDVNIRVNNNVIGYFDREWWNSPYKRGETE